MHVISSESRTPLRWGIAQRFPNALQRSKGPQGTPHSAQKRPTKSRRVGPQPPTVPQRKGHPLGNLVKADEEGSPSPSAVVLIVYSRANVLGVTPPIPAPSSVHAGRIGRARTDVALHARLAARSRPPHGGCCVPPDSQLLLIVPGRARLRERGGWRCRRCGLMAWRAGATGRLGGVWPTAWCRLLSTAARAAFLGCFGSAWRVDERGRLDDTPVLSRCCSFLVVPCVLALGALPRICPASSPSEDASPAASSRRASAVCQDANPAARDARPALFPHLL